MLPYSCVVQKKSCAMTSMPPTTTNDYKCSFTQLITSLDNVNYEARHNLTDKYSKQKQFMGENSVGLILGLAVHSKKMKNVCISIYDLRFIFFKKKIRTKGWRDFSNFPVYCFCCPRAAGRYASSSPVRYAPLSPSSSLLDHQMHWNLYLAMCPLTDVEFGWKTRKYPTLKDF